MFVTRIGVINKNGWLLTLTCDRAYKSSETDCDAYEDDEVQEYETDDEGHEDLTDAKYEELPADENDNRIYNSLEFQDEVQRLKGYGDGRHCSECHCSYSHLGGGYRYYPPPPLSTYNHPIHSITNSDIEKAMVGRRHRFLSSHYACLTVAILIAIVSIIAIVFLTINIVSNMYIKY